MQVKYSKKAQKQINSVIDYYLCHFGKQATLNLAHEIDEKVKMLCKYPEIGFIESMLRDKDILYRATLVGRYHKLIYYTKGDILRIAAFWDMRMHPDKLKTMI